MDRRGMDRQAERVLEAAQELIESSRLSPSPGPWREHPAPTTPNRPTANISIFANIWSFTKSGVPTQVIPETLPWTDRSLHFLLDWLCLTTFMYFSARIFPPSDPTTAARCSSWPNLQTAAFFGLWPSTLLVLPADRRMPVDPPLLLGLGLLLLAALPAHAALYVGLLQLGTDIAGFNIGSNHGSSLYLTLTFAYHKFLICSDWHVGVGMLTYWFFKPHICHYVITASIRGEEKSLLHNTRAARPCRSKYCSQEADHSSRCDDRVIDNVIDNAIDRVMDRQLSELRASQQTNLFYLVRTYRLFNLPVMTNLAAMTLIYFFLFPLVMDWREVPNYVLGFGPLSPCNCTIPFRDLVYYPEYLTPFLQIFLPALMAFHLRCIHIVIQSYDDARNESVLLDDMSLRRRSR